MRLRPIQGREALAFCVFMCACGAGFAPGFGFLRRFFPLCAKKRPQNAMICPGPLVYKVQTVYNKSLFTFVCLMYQQYNDTFYELRMQLESQVVQIP